MLKTILVIVASLLGIGFAACNTSVNNSMDDTNAEVVTTAPVKAITYEDISPEEAKYRLENEEGVVLLDVRTPEEYSVAHIPNSLLIPLDSIEREAEMRITDKDVPIFVYCRSGRRSIEVSVALIRLGYTQVYNLGGINDWPYEIVTK
jgi:rhodanese-related sulfurtransferase